MIIKGRQEITVDVEGAFNSITDFYKKYPNSKIETINHKEADAICESCEQAISIGDQCYTAYSEEEGCMHLCLCCGNDLDGGIPIILKEEVIF
jgi:thiamine biosynthesis lipoprotein ApbE